MQMSTRGHIRALRLQWEAKGKHPDRSRIRIVFFFRLLRKRATSWPGRCRNAHGKVSRAAAGYLSERLQMQAHVFKQRLRQSAGSRDLRALSRRPVERAEYSREGRPSVRREREPR